MISLDQVLLLQKKVETAVEKIRSLNGQVLQLQSENDALRRKCTELQNSLADKSGLVSSLEAEQNQIEETIRKALDQLDDVENAVLDSETGPALETEQDGQADFTFTETKTAEPQAQADITKQDTSVATENAAETTPIQFTEEQQEKPTDNSAGNEASSGDINGQFDIF
ncbi:MAG: cell division protein ZapB [Treponema sp.]|nr:cell division protein ZapB [Treponema sp.]